MADTNERTDAFMDTVVPYRVRDAIALRELRKDMFELRSDFNRWALAGFGALVAGFAGVITTLIVLH